MVISFYYYCCYHIYGISGHALALRQKHLDQQQLLKRDRSDHLESLRRQAEEAKRKLAERSDEASFKALKHH